MARLAIRAGVIAALAPALCLAPVPAARADGIGYLVNVTVRPGYNFPNADAALTYGHGICSDVAAGKPYAAIMERIKTAFANRDDYQASYLITQAVNELCPPLIWQLRNSAANYVPPQP